jgi:hypothetical protein
MRLGHRQLEEVIFGKTGFRRFTQDSPILPDVWMAYGLDASEPADLLLTGGALADDVPEGSREAGLLQAGKTLHVDVLKMPHHGSVRNVTEELLGAVTADHCVMSARGKYDNPDLDTLKMFSKVRGAAACTVHLTNPAPHAVKFFDADLRKAGRGYKVNVRRDPPRSIRPDLGEPFTD